MSPPGGDAQLELISRDDLVRLAALYDRFANALDPFADGRDEAEQEFNRDIRQCFDIACYKAATLRAMGFDPFRREVIKRCRRHLRAADDAAFRSSAILPDPPKAK